MACIAIDNGSYFIKSGVCGDDKPIYTNRNINNDSISPFSDKGIINDMIVMEEIWDNTINKFDNYKSIIITDSPFTPKKVREEMTEVLFESFNFDRVSIINTASASLFSYGRTTGSIIDIGYSNGYITSIYEGYYIPYSLHEFDYSFRSLNQYYCDKLSLSHDDMLNLMENNIVRDFKKKTLNSFKSNKVMKNNYFEPLFTPQLLYQEGKGIIDIILQSIKSVDVGRDINDKLLSNICCTGGCFKINNLSQRILDELINKNPKCKVKCQSECNIAPWIGISIVGSLSMFNNFSVSKELYNEKGSYIIHRPRIGISSNDF